MKTRVILASELRNFALALARAYITGFAGNNTLSPEQEQFARGVLFALVNVMQAFGIMPPRELDELTTQFAAIMPPQIGFIDRNTDYE